jgi:hypothetical protein
MGENYINPFPDAIKYTGATLDSSLFDPIWYSAGGMG